MYPQPELFFWSEQEFRTKQHTLAEHLATVSYFRRRNRTEREDWSIRKRLCVQNRGIVHQLDLMILAVFSSLNNSMILLYKFKHLWRTIFHE